MGAITDGLSAAFRDYETDGIPASGPHKPDKSDARAVGPLIEAALSNVALGSMLGVTKDTRAHLNADLAHAADTVALVYADATDANNDLYVKVGASGTGSWTLTTTFHDAVEGIAQPYVDEAAASAALCTSVRDLLVTGFSLLAERNATSQYPVAGGFTSFSVGMLIGEGGYNLGGKPITATQARRLQLGTLTTYARRKLWLRDPASPNITHRPDGTVGDTLLSNERFSADDLDLTPGGAYGSPYVRLPTQLDEADANGWILIEQWLGEDSDGAAQAIGYGTAPNPGGLPVYARGWFNSTVGPGTISDSAPVLAWRLLTDKYLPETVDPQIVPDFLLPDKLFFTEHCPVPIDVSNMASKRVDRDVLDITLESELYPPYLAPTATAPPMPLKLRGNQQMEVDPDRLNTDLGLDVTVRQRDVPDTRYQKTIAVSVAPWDLNGTTPRIMISGDSHGVLDIPAALRMQLLARRSTPTFVGELSSGYDGLLLDSKHEARGGKAMADYIYAREYDPTNVNTMKPCVGAFAISHAAYLALPATGNAGVDAKSNRNPFLVEDAGAGSYNGYKWSLEQYGTFTGQAVDTLNFYFESIGSNDLLQWADDQATALATLSAGIGIKVASIRAIAPDCVIGFYSPGVGWRDGINDVDQFYARNHAMLQTHYAAIKALVDAGDDKLFYIPAGLFQDPNRFGQLTVVSTDAYGLETVVDNVTAGGYLHSSGTNSGILAHVLASVVAATI